MEIDCGKCGGSFATVEEYRAHLPCVIKAEVDPKCVCRYRPWACPVHPAPDKRGL